MEERALRKLSFSSLVDRPDGESWKLVVSVARVSFMDNDPLYRMVTFYEVQKVMEFVNARRIQELSIDNLKVVDLMWKLPPGMSMASIDRIIVGDQTNRAEISHAIISDVRLGALMTRFPSASNIIGSPQFWAPDGIRTQASPNGTSITALGELAGALIRGVKESCTVEIMKVAEAMEFIHDKDWLEHDLPALGTLDELVSTSLGVENTDWAVIIDYNKELRP
ncbi:hypothetical protein HDU93_005528 [Gonapodya sp. JEL0774]|nr:hypothetical protein HDU93_005528 [Gonapodya sp. JEL0774]